MAASMRGRGRLSGLELLPDVCAPVIAQAKDALQDRDRTQTDIYEEFCAGLRKIEAEYRGEIEINIPSFSAFNRYSIRLASLTARINETREIASTLAAKFDAGASDDLTLIAAETIKTLIMELLTRRDDRVEPKEAMALANALRSAVQAQSVSTDRRRKLEQEFDAGAEAAVDAVAKAGAKVDKEEVLRLIRESYTG